ncbi:hypothetical protein TRFO_12605 [Tritrichomonas foetus]|uniref:Serpin domain-containing protein n=1 Tax=Tritrichomonas foetus TaxID=1144522 RepID=A0A1J4L5M9_9EUKA|nr:hypothetical protein TRFO_12605 [Tritrichomonas foetus]|eukprot:OHT17254.1 hypothetical protein TRFO_12605 [Tritrichomonas foetus]
MHLNRINDIIDLEFHLFRSAFHDFPTQFVISPYSSVAVLSILFDLSQTESLKTILNSCFHSSILHSLKAHVESIVSHNMNAIHDVNKIFTVSPLKADLKSVQSILVLLDESKPIITQINRYVKNETNGKIPDLINPLIKTPQNSIIASAVSLFSCRWEKGLFTSLKTCKFYGLQKNAPITMLLAYDKKINCTETNSLTAIELPFEDPNFGLLVVTPKMAGEIYYKKMIKKMRSKKLKKLIKGLKPKDVNISFPKIEIETAPFNPFKSFGFGDSKIKLSENESLGFIRQKCVITINESGVCVDNESNSLPLSSESHKYKKFNHPFAFFIYTHDPLSIIMCGTMMDTLNSGSVDVGL